MAAAVILWAAQARTNLEALERRFCFVSKQPFMIPANPIAVQRHYQSDDGLDQG